MKRNKAVRFAAPTLAAVLAVALPGCSAGVATLAGPAVGMPARAEPETRISVQFVQSLRISRHKPARKRLPRGENVCYSL